MVLTQHITLRWYKDCRGGKGAVQRGQFPKAALLPKNFFAYIPFGIPSHQLVIQQQPDGFFTQINRRNLVTFSAQNSLKLWPIELIMTTENRCQVWYRYDLHRGAAPERHKYDPTVSRYVPLRELAMELEPGEYGRSICNGRFVDFDLGTWWYEMDIVNVLYSTGRNRSLDCFQTAVPDYEYQQIAPLR